MKHPYPLGTMVYFIKRGKHLLGLIVSNEPYDKHEIVGYGVYVDGSIYDVVWHMNSNRVIA